MVRLLSSCLAIGATYAVSTGLLSLLSPAFLPSPGGESVSRRQLVQGLGITATGLGAKDAFADNQGERYKAMKTWAPAILGLEDAVAKGDTQAVLAKQKQFKYLTTFWQ